MNVKFGKLIHGCDYNPDQWLETPQIIDEDMRLMRLAGINSATVNIFSWATLEPEEGKFDFSFLDNIMDRLYENGVDVILATPSGARPAWLAQKYPEVLRTDENGIRNEFGVRHNHCLTSPVYREKVRVINEKLAERYKNHPALKLWHISNEYSGECHCESCRLGFIEWLKDYYNENLDELNRQWWNGFWSHTVTDWQQLSTPKARGENHSSAQKLCFNRFVSDMHISFFENEIEPIRRITPNIPVTTNFMRLYDGIDYQKFAGRVDIVSWDNYPSWDTGDNMKQAAETAFVHDCFRSMRSGQPFLMMESTPSIVNWHDVNKIPKPLRQHLSAVQAIAHGSDSVQYFQWRKSRGGHEKFHGAVVDHCGHENTRVFKEVSLTGEVLKKLSKVSGARTRADAAVICDWENMWAVKHFCGYNNLHRDYTDECIKWYEPLLRRGVACDVISQQHDFSDYRLIIAPFMYMLKDGVIEKIEEFVKNGGVFLATYLTGIVNKNDLCYLGGFPALSLKDVFGVWCEETDSLPDGTENSVIYSSKSYAAEKVCDIIHLTTARSLAEYGADFYKGRPALTVNDYCKGKAYYAAARTKADFVSETVSLLLRDAKITPDASFDADDGLLVRKRGDFIFILNFTDGALGVCLDGEYEDALSSELLSGRVKIEENAYLILKRK